MAQIASLAARGADLVLPIEATDLRRCVRALQAPSLGLRSRRKSFNWPRSSRSDRCGVFNSAIAFEQSVNNEFSPVGFFQFGQESGLFGGQCRRLGRASGGRRRRLTVCGRRLTVQRVDVVVVDAAR